VSPKTPTRSFALFDPAMTVAAPDEARLSRELDRTMAQIRETTFVNSGHAHRSVHTKSHGLLEAQMEVVAGLPPVLAQGLFARPHRYPVVMRFSTPPAMS